MDNLRIHEYVVSRPAVVVRLEFLELHFYSCFRDPVSVDILCRNSTANNFSYYSELVPAPELTSLLHRFDTIRITVGSSPYVSFLDHLQQQPNIYRKRKK